MWALAWLCDKQQIPFYKLCCDVLFSGNNDNLVTNSMYGLQNSYHDSCTALIISVLEVTESSTHAARAY